MATNKSFLASDSMLPIFHRGEDLFQSKLSIEADIIAGLYLMIIGKSIMLWFLYSYCLLHFNHILSFTQLFLDAEKFYFRILWHRFHVDFLASHWLPWEDSAWIPHGIHVKKGRHFYFFYSKSALGNSHWIRWDVEFNHFLMRNWTRIPSRIHVVWT